ncbi:MAG: hypothetical protein AB7K04_09310 [Pseudorhodoplanes sp.]
MTDGDKLDALIARAMRGGAEHDAEAASRVLASLSSLPPQRRRWWPAALLAFDLSPAWPRVAALAGAAALGLFIGLAAPDLETFDGAMTTASAASDIDLGMSEPELVTGARL